VAEPGQPAVTSTRGIRRRDLEPGVPGEATSGTQAMTPKPPPLPATPPGRFGDLSRASIEQITSMATRPPGAVSASTIYNRRSGVQAMLQHLAGFDGATWQERWEAAGLNSPDRPAAGLSGQDRTPRLLHQGTRLLFQWRVVRPSLAALHANHPAGYAESFRQMQDDPLLDEFFNLVQNSKEGHTAKLAATFDVAAAMTVFGICLAGLTPEGLLYYGIESRPRLFRGRHGLPGRQAWHFLHLMGHFPAALPAMMRAAVYRGPRPVTEMVDRHQISNAAVRDLLVDYITRRSAGIDYTTTEALAQALAGLFWSTIEKLHPAQRDLRLSRSTYEQWKAEVSVLPGGKPRKNVEALQLAVRSFYLDLQSWAITEPERWARWAVPCPVRDSELRGHSRRRRRVVERMADRTRQRQPLLPVLAEHVDQHHRDLQGLLHAALAAAPGEEFIHQGRTYQRTNSRHDQDRAMAEGAMPARVIDQAAGRTFNVALEEDRAFWEWAIVETLRHSGCRIEELCELTHLSIRQYRRPNGEVAALLVIAPSKTDRERVIPMPAELFAVIAAIIRRHLQHQPAIPLLRRYDKNERTWSEPMPFLFQRKLGTTRAVLSVHTIQRMLQRPCLALAQTRPEFTGLTFSAHDFRRIFTTELVNNGLPIHIGAALLGHLSLQTTRGYVAVFNEDLIRHYQTFLDRRRQLRASEEYRPPTDAEWTQFEEHFDKRKVELGTCGRPYKTPCTHEHACIRCPVLQVDPKMLTRLDEIETDLLARRQQAETEGWRGEIEGIDLTLSFLRSKRAHTQRFTRRVQLGLPRMHQPPS
jgi:site-specific recombinase XerD